MQRVLTGAGGGMMGELAAIAAFPAVAALYQKAQGTKFGSKVLPQFQHDAKKAPPTSKMGKVAEFLMKTKKGRLITAGLLGGGIVGGQHMLTGRGGEDLGDATTSSMASTLMLDLAAATALPLAAMKREAIVGCTQSCSRCSKPFQCVSRSAASAPRISTFFHSCTWR